MQNDGCSGPLVPDFVVVIYELLVDGRELVLVVRVWLGGKNYGVFPAVRVN